ncbi:MAG: hypothetical protein A2Z69_00545 [Bacteroidetes bacterium RBG_13_44_24]|nr:MAG: hypothetical protein A2Z69_00545 [Bacteroidetes bacterium RBG_13_44_24]
MPNRHYRVIQYNKGSVRYIQLIVQYPEPPGTWRTNAVRSYGQVNHENETQAQSDYSELQAYAADFEAPIPTGVVDEVIWRNFQKVAQKGLPSPLDPAGVMEALQGAASDMAHLIGWVVSDAVGDVITKVNITQPDMNDADKRRLIQWLSSFPPDVQRKLLTYRWRWV